MKTIRMIKDYSYRATPRVFLQYIGGCTYERVPEAAVRAILAAKAGEVVDPIEPIEVNAPASRGIIERLMGQ
jgi:hypothetical protein